MRLRVVVCVAIVLASGATAVSAGDETSRVAGSLDDPVGVAVAFSGLAAPDGSVGVKIGRADNFADSLAAAQYEPSWPLLLTPSGRLDEAVRTEIRRLGAMTATVIGGTAAISEGVVAELRAEGLAVTRLAGVTRFATAVSLADATDHTRFLLVRAGASAGEDPTRAFADSLAAGALAAAAGDVGLLLTNSDELDSTTAEFLLRRQAESDGDIEVVIVGGTAAISSATEAQVRSITPSVGRIAGATRAITATMLAEEHDNVMGVVLLDGQHPNAWAAGFTAAPFARATGSPVVLTMGGALNEETRAWLQNRPVEQLLCGPDVSEGVCSDAAATIETQPPAAPSILLRTDGLGRWAFGHDGDALVHDLTSELGQPTSVNDEPLPYFVENDPYAEDLGFNDGAWVDDPEYPFLYWDQPHSREVCWPHLCVTLGGTNPDTMVFRAYNHQTSAGVDQTQPLWDTAEGVGPGDTFAALRAAYPELTVDWGEGNANGFLLPGWPALFDGAIADANGRLSSRVNPITTHGRDDLRPDDVPADATVTALYTGSWPIAACC